MAVKLPNGSVVSIASAYGASFPISALSNAKPPVAAAAAHGLEAGSIIVVNSGWGKVTNRVARASALTADTFSLEGYDTTNVARFPTGAGIGSAREVTAWTQISQVLDVASSGGDQQFYTYGFLEDDGDDRQQPTNRTPFTFTFTLADDPEMPHHDVLLAADESKAPHVIRIAVPDRGVLLWNAYVGYSGIPTMTRNQGMTCALSLSLESRPMRYRAST
ncbi:phage tail protein [Pigmentiphaga litoralis]|uniref:phage tail protein n=1 Tax=Pigmentiphaga litoralis TaxID=516702 RepID=UPI00167BB8E2|nr:phage tail protein [Pigmentiphaga litoralis]GGX32805.1 phage tail protein [Pigmentiphaga litoralis]